MWNEEFLKDINYNKFSELYSYQRGDVKISIDKRESEVKVIVGGMGQIVKVNPSLVTLSGIRNIILDENLTDNLKFGYLLNYFEFDCN